ncbi:calumenin [Cocos nucifera]|uniref:Calumenin n=1 Tax=Cocos nucifera TaxID=13894 RepID=A0A8K0NBW7_COCNU|nr:calumenin [Cocos nucifera]
MGKSSLVIIIYTTLALLLLVLIVSLFSPTNLHHRHRPHRRLILRPNSSTAGDRHHPPIPFDPLISDIEIRREDKQWEREHVSIPHHDGQGEAEPEWEDFMNAEDYINDDGRFNITNRIILLFPKIDVSPGDGFVSSDELVEWNLQQATRETMHRTQRDMELHDKNHDGFVSFHEYEGPAWDRHSDDKTSSGNDMGWWKKDHFNASDVDGDGLLNLTEFNEFVIYSHFLHPADSNNPKLIRWLCKEEIRERDKDKDGKLSFEEYFHGLFDAIQDYDEFYNHSDSSMEKKLFMQLDRDNDGFLSDDEVKAVIGILHPSEHYYAKQQADYVVSQADSDKDGRLSLREMIEHPYVFYSAIFSDEEDDDYHDEFR